MRREEVLELMKDLHRYLGDMGLTPCVGNNYWPADDSYVLVHASKLYREDLERILTFAKERNLEVLIDIRHGLLEIEFYDTKHVGGDW